MSTFTTPLTNKKPGFVEPNEHDGFVLGRGREMYRITHAERLRPFLMSVVSDCDLWMYTSSTGGLTAGRGNPDHSLFPYETDDVLHQRCGVTGPITLLRIHCEDGRGVLWEPFSPVSDANIHRNLHKTVLCDQLTFEEHHGELGLTFSYSWRASAQFGWVRTCILSSERNCRVEVLDGLLNLLPAGADLKVQQQFSCLINAYTQAEIYPSNLATVSLTSLIVDRAEALESLTANVAWSLAADGARVSLSSDAISTFRAGKPLISERLLQGGRPAYLLSSNLSFEPGQSEEWRIVVDANRSQVQVAQLIDKLKDASALKRELIEDIERSSAALWKNVASADGLQATLDHRSTAHHAANVLFNNMRGGVFARGYQIPMRDFRDFLHSRNTNVHAAYDAQFSQLDLIVDYHQLLQVARESKSPDLLRFTLEYLPLTFSRRHGDPSRPWNRFDIRVRDERGEQVLDYQGNWRDIFQNWEAMCQSFPTYLESMIAKFVNASTIDGFNPYRISRGGIDWEVPEPGNPWSHIGYWGDHQIVYLLKLLEASRRHHPEALLRMLDQPVFSYAHVPYRIKAYEQIVRDPKNTIDFDDALHRELIHRSRAIGADGRLLADASGRVHHVTLVEKLLVPMLSKLSNFVPGAGIWINTQRPEWNDANNALVGYGVSMVTLYYLRRYVDWCAELFGQAAVSTAGHQATISSEVVDWLDALWAVLRRNAGILPDAAVRDTDRRRILDELGRAFCAYRAKVYREGFSGTRTVSYDSLLDFLVLVRQYLDHTVTAGRRTDGLYHSYNLLSLSPDGRRASVEHLHEMLEGQVAVLSSGILTAEEAIGLLESLFNSALFRDDQQSFMLYPQRDMPGFMQKNSIPTRQIEKIPLLTKLLKSGDNSVINRGVDGKYRFNSQFHQSSDLAMALDRLARLPELSPDVQRDRQAVLAAFEEVFQHRRFTGRSGTMFGYEGIGCIYWHMVCKLLLAVQECFFWTSRKQETSPQIHELAKLYYRVREGLGFNKSALLYGAFPFEPYSHTPQSGGAQQPGMTGQVKEEILARWGELGVLVDQGRIEFRPALLRAEEFGGEAFDWIYCDVQGKSQTLRIGEHSLAFTICQVPVIYRIGSNPLNITIHRTDGTTSIVSSGQLDVASSASIWERRGEIDVIHVQVPVSSILPRDSRQSGNEENCNLLDAGASGEV